MSGPRSARNLCQPRFSSASPHLRPLAIFSRLGSIDHQRTPRATLANTLSGNFITNCNLSSCQLSIPRVRSGILPSQTCYQFTCRSVKTDPDSSAHNLCKRLQSLQASKRQSVPSLFACSVFESGTMQYGRLLVPALLPIRRQLALYLLFNCIRSAPCFGRRTSCSLIICCIRTASCSDTKHLVQRSTPCARIDHQV